MSVPKDPFGIDVTAFFRQQPPREERPYVREHRVLKPAAVTAAARRSDAMIARILAGDRAGAEALITDADRGRRKTGAETPERMAQLRAAGAFDDVPVSGIHRTAEEDAAFQRRRAEARAAKGRT